jgi:branched-chain amino acid transport system permease protein
VNTVATTEGSLPAAPQATTGGRRLPDGVVREVTGTSRWSLLLWPALAVAVVALAYGVQDNYWLQIVVNAELMVIAAVGLFVTFGLNGQVSLGQAGFYAIGGYGAGLLVSKLGWPFLPALLAGVAAAALVGLALGIPALRLRGHYLALVTLGFGQIIALILINWAWLSGGATGVRNIVAPLFGSFELVTVPDWAVFIGLISVAAVFVVHRIHHSSFGRAMRAVRDSEVAAAAMGVSLSHIKVLAFTIGAAFAGLAGALQAGFVTYISPGTYTLTLSVTILSMVVVGGSRSPWGAVVGAVVLTFLPEVLRPVQEYYLLIYGVLLLVMVAYVPQGVWGLLQSLVRRIAGVRPRSRSGSGSDRAQVGGQ